MAIEHELRELKLINFPKAYPLGRVVGLLLKHQNSIINKIKRECF
jgi:hypothetical protein